MAATVGDVTQCLWKGSFGVSIRSSLSLRASAYKLLVTKDGVYCEISDGATYAIELLNRGVKADCEISIDGKVVGLWRVFSEICVERPADDKLARKFTAVLERSEGAAAAGVEQGHKDNGLIKIVCKPEKVKPPARDPHLSLSLNDSIYEEPTTRGGGLIGFDSPWTANDTATGFGGGFPPPPIGGPPFEAFRRPPVLGHCGYGMPGEVGRAISVQDPGPATTFDQSTPERAAAYNARLEAAREASDGMQYGGAPDRVWAPMSSWSTAERDAAARQAAEHEQRARAAPAAAAYGAPMSYGHQAPPSADTHASAATVLGDESKQTFRTIDAIEEYDVNGTVTFQIRLVIKKVAPPPQPIAVRKAIREDPTPPRID